MTCHRGFVIWKSQGLSQTQCKARNSDERFRRRLDIGGDRSQAAATGAANQKEFAK
jgi:hypothetical protein